MTSVPLRITVEVVASLRLVVTRIPEAISAGSRVTLGSVVARVTGRL
jgi:hypothetical protein